MNPRIVTLADLAHADIGVDEIPIVLHTPAGSFVLIASAGFYDRWANRLDETYTSVGDDFERLQRRFVIATLGHLAAKPTAERLRLCAFHAWWCMNFMEAFTETSEVLAEADLPMLHVGCDDGVLTLRAEDGALNLLLMPRAGTEPPRPRIH